MSPKILNVTRMNRVHVIRTICSGLGINTSTLPSQVQQSLFHNGRLILGAATDWRTGKIYERNLDSVASEFDSVLRHNVMRQFVGRQISRETIKEILVKNQMIEHMVGPDMLRASYQLMRDLASAGSVKEVLDVTRDSIVKMGIASGVRVYIRMVQTGQIKYATEVNMVGGTRFDDFKMPTGEKRQLIYRLGIVRRLMERSTGQVRAQYMELHKKLRFWKVARDSWPEFGINRTIYGFVKETMRQHGLDKIPSKLRVEGDNHANLIKALIDMQKEKLYLAEEHINGHGIVVFSDFIQANNINKKEQDELEKTYLAAINEIKRIAGLTFGRIYPKAEIIARNWARNNQAELLLTEANFMYSFDNYVDALADIDNDRENLGCLAEHVSENFYYTVLNRDHKIIAIVLANNHKQNATTRSTTPLFADPDKEAILLDMLSEINDSIAKALMHEEGVEELSRTFDKLKDALTELEVDKKELTGMLELAKQIVDEKFPLIGDHDKNIKGRLDYAVEIISKLCKRNGEDIGSSIMLVDRDAQETMTIVAAENKPKKVLGQKVKYGEGVAGHVIKTGEDLFITDIEKFKDSHPELYEQLRAIRHHDNNTFMCAGLRSDENVLGVVNVDGAMLTNKEMTFLKSIAILISLAVKNSQQAEALKEQAIKMEKLAEKRKELADKLKVLAETDDLTKLLRRNFLEEKYIQELEHAKTLKTDLVAMMIDIDHFKLANDEHGHKTGDMVLEKVANIIKSEIGENGVVSRFGGEEIFIVLPRFSKEDGNKKGEQIREKIAETPFSSLDGKPMKITVSIGVASYSEDYDEKLGSKAADALIDKADNAMYGAKLDGRNRCYMYNKDVGEKVEKRRKEEKEAAGIARRLLEKLDIALENSDLEKAKRLLAELKEKIEICMPR